MCYLRGEFFQICVQLFNKFNTSSIQNHRENDTFANVLSK